MRGVFLLTAFSILTRTLFEDPHLSQAATYQPSNGDPAVSLRVIERTQGSGDGYLDTGATLASTRIAVRALDVARPLEGDTVSLADGRDFRVRAAHRGSRSLVWELDVDEQSS